MIGLIYMDQYKYVDCRKCAFYFRGMCQVDYGRFPKEYCPEFAFLSDPEFEHVSNCPTITFDEVISLFVL